MHLVGFTTTANGPTNVKSLIMQFFPYFCVAFVKCVCLCFTQHSLLLLGTDKQKCIVKCRPQQVAVSAYSAELPPQRRLLHHIN